MMQVTARTIPMPHVVLLGDSVFDNAAYTDGGPDVVTQLRERLPDGWRATLAAVDGAGVDDVPRQLDRVPPDATHLVLSAGGNDALPHVHLLDEPARTVAEGLARIAAAVTLFDDAIVRVALERGLPVVDLRLVCREPADYANPIEPSSVGGAKIARVLGAAGRPDLETRLVAG